MAKKKQKKEVAFEPVVKIRYRCNVCAKISDTKECCGKQDFTTKLI